MKTRAQELAELAGMAKRLAQAEAKVEQISESMRALPSDSRARAGRGGGRKATASAKLRIACEARDRVEAEFTSALAQIILLQDLRQDIEEARAERDRARRQRDHLLGGLSWAQATADNPMDADDDLRLDDMIEDEEDSDA